MDKDFAVLGKKIIIVDDKGDKVKIVDITENLVNGITITILKPKENKKTPAQRSADSMEKMVEIMEKMKESLGYIQRSMK